METTVSLAELRLTVNGQSYNFSVDARVSLLDLLRDHCGLTGTKVGCNHGQCGACTVLVNGRRINSCLSLALLHDGDSVTTIEGMAQGGELAPVQKAFLVHDAFQCGYCTPGQICSAAGLLEEAARGEPSSATRALREVRPVELNESEVRERMSGNLCR